MQNLINYKISLLTLGAAHVDDLMYILYISQYFSQYNATDPEVNIINILTSTFTEFARTGYVYVCMLNFTFLNCFVNR